MPSLVDDPPVRGGVSHAEALATVRALFDRYEVALVTADLDALAGWFWPDATRYGTDGNQGSGDEIDAARRRTHQALDRTLHDTLVRVVAPGVVVAETRFTRTSGEEGRQTQVWTERGGEWRIVHAHVSMLPD